MPGQFENAPQVMTLMGENGPRPSQCKQRYQAIAIPPKIKDFKNINIKSASY